MEGGRLRIVEARGMRNFQSNGSQWQNHRVTCRLRGELDVHNLSRHEKAILRSGEKTNIWSLPEFQATNVVSSTTNAPPKRAGGSFPRSSQSNALLCRSFDESKIDEFVLMHMQDIARERIRRGRTRR